MPHPGFLICPCIYLPELERTLKRQGPAGGVAGEGFGSQGLVYGRHTGVRQQKVTQQWTCPACLLLGDIPGCVVLFCTVELPLGLLSGGPQGRGPIAEQSSPKPCDFVACPDCLLSATALAAALKPS